VLVEALPCAQPVRNREGVCLLGSLVFLRVLFFTVWVLWLSDFRLD